MAEWLEIYLEVTPWMAWFFLGMGVPWALVLLPRRDWRDGATVCATGLALGPLFGSLWLFLLGTIGTFTFLGAILGTIVIAAAGAIWAWYRYRATDPQIHASVPKDIYTQFHALQIALGIMLVIGLLANIWDTAFWPFLRYDTLWTFGYNPKIFILEGHIPNDIDYYPQLVPLTFTFGNLVHHGTSDYAARTAIPWFMLSSVMAAYTLGWRLYGRRLTGILTAALWLLTPAVLVWSSSGDLEHPMAIYFSLATLFVVLAWQEADQNIAQRYAVLAGFMLGAAMWTKPTAGAFIFGMALLVIGQTVHTLRSQNWQKWRERIRLLLITGLVAAPIGGVWYVRNIVIGHPWTNLPPDYWPDLAQRSGMQLNWVYYAAVLAAIFVITHTISGRKPIHIIMAGLSIVLLSIAILPTMLSLPDEGLTAAVAWDAINGFREPTRSLSAIEGGFFVTGLLLLTFASIPTWGTIQQNIKLAWLYSWVLGLPFFMVYFWSFSYHYRLALTILPIILATIAAQLTSLLTPFVVQNTARRWGTVAIAVMLCLPAPIAATYHTALNTFNNTGIDTTREKYQYANPALLNLVAFLERYANETNSDHFHILAPGENRLAFFFPEWDIDDETLPTEIDDLAEYDIFIDFIAEFLWREAELYPNITQTWTDIAPLYPLGQTGQPLALDAPYGLPQPRLLRPIMTPIDDGQSRYEVFAVDTEAPYTYIEPETVIEDAIFGEGIQLLGYDLPTTTFAPGQTYTLKFYWRGTAQAPPTADYSIYVHLVAVDTTDDISAQADGGLLYGNYPTRFLTPYTILQDRRDWTMPQDLQPGQYQIRIGIYDPQTFIRLPLHHEGAVIGDGWTLTEIIIVNE